MKKVIITGATSMIACALERLLIKKGIAAVCIVRPGSKKTDNIPQNGLVTVVECALDELSTLPQKISGNYDAMFHFGWAGTGGGSRNDAVLQNLNINYTLDAVTVAHNLGCKVFVGAGSQAEYGPVGCDLSPDTPTNPINGYGIAKYAAGRLSRILCAKYGIRQVWARILSVYGPGDNDFTMMMSCVRAFLTGQHMSFTKGEQLWDYLYCDDAARAMFLLAEKGRDGAVYTLGSGKARPLREYILAARDAANPAAQAGLGERPYPAGQVMNLCADISRLCGDTGFVPLTDFETGIRKTVQWQKQRL